MPGWWMEGEDDCRMAEVLYVLFNGEVGARLEEQIKDW